MQIKNEIIINKNRETVWKVFDNPDNLYKWQPFLKSVQNESGEPNQIGAVSILTFEEDGKQIKMKETITARNCPQEFSGIFETEGVRNRVNNQFIEIDKNSTNWVMLSEFEFFGKYKFFTSMILKSIQKRINISMKRFKQLVETGS